MSDLLKKSNKEKHQFKSYYCASCRQQKPCQLLTGWDSEWRSYCCACYYEREKSRAKEYSSYEKVLVSKQRESKEHIQQLQLLKGYLGCKHCQSKEVDAYNLYENNQLVCQPCLMVKEGGASSPISFAGQSKWYKRFWKIDLTEWLENYKSLPVNKNCADKWKENNYHLKNCVCLEVEAREIFELFSNLLKEKEEQLKECQCEISPKVRVSSDFYAWCEKCDNAIIAASKKRVIKNRNDPRFWGLKTKEKVLCGACLEQQKEQMPTLRRAEFVRYRKVGRL